MAVRYFIISPGDPIRQQKLRTTFLIYWLLGPGAGNGLESCCPGLGTAMEAETEPASAASSHSRGTAVLPEYETRATHRAQDPKQKLVWG